MLRRSIVILSVLAFAVPVFAAAQTSCANVTKNISRGSRGSDVLALQQFFIAQTLLPTDSASGYFGAATEKAVQMWQTSRNIVSSGTAGTTGFGAVGARTRASLCATAFTPAAAPTPLTSPSTPPPVNPAPIVAPATPVISPVVGVGAPPSIDSFYASPNLVNIAGENVVLTWSATQASNCSVAQGSGHMILSGNAGTSGIFTVQPASTTPYSIDCIGLGDGSSSTPATATRSVTVVVLHTLPTCSITTDKPTYKYGDTITLSWTSTGADSRTWKHDLPSDDFVPVAYGQVEESGHYFFTANSIVNQSATLRIVGPGGSASCTGSWTVTAPVSFNGLSSQLAALEVALESLLSRFSH